MQSETTTGCDEPDYKDLGITAAKARQARRTVQLVSALADARVVEAAATKTLHRALGVPEELLE